MNRINLVKHLQKYLSAITVILGGTSISFLLIGFIGETYIFNLISSDILMNYDDLFFSLMAIGIATFLLTIAFFIVTVVIYLTSIQRDLNILLNKKHENK